LKTVFYIIIYNVIKQRQRWIKHSEESVYRHKHGINELCGWKKKTVFLFEQFLTKIRSTLEALQQQAQSYVIKIKDDSTTI